MNKLSPRAVELFIEADPLAKVYAAPGGLKKVPIEEQERLARMMEELHGELGIPPHTASPLFVDEHDDLRSQVLMQELRILLLEAAKNFTH